MTKDEEIFLKLKAAPCALPFFHPDYKSPTYEDISNLLKISGLSQRQTALITGVNSNDKGSTTVRRWKSKSNAEQYRVIPYSAWRLLLEYVGIVDVDDVRDLMKNDKQQKNKSL